MAKLPPKVFQVLAAILILVGSASAFITPVPTLLTQQHRTIRANVAQLHCKAGGEISRKNAAIMAGLMPFVWASNVWAEVDDEEEEEQGPASVPREVTYKVNDELCDKHPTWKQCRKKTINLKAPQVKLDNGLIIQELAIGKGNTPNKGDTCTIHYSLYYNGDEIESSRESSGLAASPIGFQYGVEKGTGSVIQAISLGMEGMKVGGIRRITSPPEFAYGDKGKKPRVPPGATVQFDVQLLTVKRAGTNPISRQGSGSEKSTGLFDLF